MQRTEDVKHSFFAKSVRPPVLASSPRAVQAAEHGHHLILGVDVHRIGRIMSNPGT